MRRHGLSKENLNSVVYIRNNKIFLQSSAALNIFKDLGLPWKLMYILVVLPSPLRDFFYKIIAKYRYIFFGKKTSCVIPTIESRKRFLA